MRCLHRAGRRPTRQRLPDTGDHGGRQGGDDDRGPGGRREAACAATGLHYRRRLAVRLLYAGPDHERCGLAQREPCTRGRRGARADERQYLPLWRLRQHHQGHSKRARDGADVKDFQYVRPKDLNDALERGGAGRTSFVAGGTLLVDLLRLDVERPEMLIDLNGVLSSAISWDARGLTVGAVARNTDLAYHEQVLAEMPVLSEALLSGASPQLRNMASVGGNLLQRTRCAYFRDVGVDACNKRKPGSGCAALEGYSRMHAVLGVSDKCIAAHPSDMCVALLALDAVVRTRRRSGARELPLGDLHTLPGEHPGLETALEPGEIVPEVFVPHAPFARRSAYVKSRDRAAYAFALASAAAALELDGQEIKSARVALGGVGSKPWRAREVESALIGKPATRETFEAAARLCMNGARTTADNRFKLELAPRVVVAALSAAGSKA